MGGSFVAKYTSANGLLWAKTFGFGGNVTIYALTVDSQNNIIVAGYFNTSVDFGGATLTSAGGTDIFVVKYSSSGSLIWAKRFGSAGNDIGYGLAVDASDNIILAAQFQSIVDFGTGGLTALGGMNIVLVKLSPGSQGIPGTAVWAKAWGSSMIDTPYAVSVDRSGDIVVTGQTYGPSNLGGGSIGSGGIFVAKYSGADGSYRWAKAIGGSTGYGITADPNTGNIFITGDNGNGMLLAGYDPSGNSLWSKVYGGSGDLGNSVSVDATGNLVVTGQAKQAIDFTGTGIYTTGQGFVLASFTVSGNSAPAFQWVRRAKIASTGFSAAHDFAGHILAAGNFQGATLDFGGISATAPLGTTDGFVVQYNQ
jgi:hypothetical protein